MAQTTADDCKLPATPSELVTGESTETACTLMHQPATASALTVSGSPHRQPFAVSPRGLIESHRRGFKPAKQKPARRRAPSQPVVRREWTEEEDQLLIRPMSEVEPGRPVPWSSMLLQFPGRIGKQLRERWENHLRPGIIDTPWTEAEERLFVEAHMVLGNKWAAIGKILWQAGWGRTENGTKNHWHATLRKTGPGGSMVLYEYQCSSGERRRCQERQQRSSQGKRTHAQGPSASSSESGDDCPAYPPCQISPAGSRTRRRRRCAPAIPDCDAGCDASGSEDAEDDGNKRHHRRVPYLQQTTRALLGQPSRLPPCQAHMAPSGIAMDDMAAHDDSCADVFPELDMDLSSMSCDLGIDELLADKASHAPLVAPLTGLHSSPAPEPLEGDSSLSEFLSYLQAPDDTADDCFDLCSIPGRKLPQAACTSASPASGLSLPSELANRQVKAACSKQRDDAALCSFALRSSSADIQVPFRELHISGHAAAVSDPGKGIEGVSKGAMVNQSHSGDGASASSASTCWAAGDWPNMIHGVPC